MPSEQNGKWPDVTEAKLFRRKLIYAVLPNMEETLEEAQQNKKVQSVT
jgi:hypothetical protein